MKKAKKAENPIRKIIGICLILLFVMGVGVMASNAKLYNVKIILSNGYIMNVTTSKTKVSEILDENHIILFIHFNFRKTQNWHKSSCIYRNNLFNIFFVTAADRTMTFNISAQDNKYFICPKITAFYIIFSIFIFYRDI